MLFRAGLTSIVELTDTKLALLLFLYMSYLLASIIQSVFIVFNLGLF